jgi:ribonuclease VapC
MVLDTSAILAMLFDEPEAEEFQRLVEEDPVVLVSAVSRVEAAFVVEGRKGDAGRIRLTQFFDLVASSPTRWPKCRASRCCSRAPTSA